MSTKITLGARPKTFKPMTLTVALPAGGEGQLPVTFNYFTKTESGKLFDELVEEAKAKDASVEGADSAGFSLETVMSKTRDHNAKYMARVLNTWGLDEPLSLESLQQLDDEIPAASVAIMEAFRNATQQGRLGN